MSRPTASRVHGPRKILGELFRLSLKVERAYAFRETTIEEKAWLRVVADALDAAIKSGKVLPYRPDPVETRTVRKSTRRDLAGFPADDRWQVGAYER